MHHQLREIKEYFNLWNRKTIPFFYEKIMSIPKVFNNIFHLIVLGKNANGIFHDMMNPLTSIILSINSTKSQELQEAAQNLSTFINSMQKQLQNKSIKDLFKISEAINESILLIKYKALYKNIRIINITQHDCSILGNKNNFIRSILNIINNAMEAYDDCKKEKQDVIIKTYIEDKHINVSISDFGCGISLKNKNKIFRYFYTNKKDGTGIGLATTNHIIKKDFNGTIDFETQLNKGTTFIIKIPIKNSHLIQHQ